MEEEIKYEGLIVLKDNYIYIFRDKNSVLVYRLKDKLEQYILFNKESSHHYKQFDLFVKIILSSQKQEYDNIIDIYTLAALYNVGAVKGYKTEKVIAKTPIKLNN